MLEALTRSTLDWWAEAGVDVLVEEAPRDWLAPVRPPAAATAAPAIPAAPDPAALPHELAAFRAFLLADPSVPGAPGARIDAAGDPAAGTMIVVDWPEAGDRARRTLLGDEPGALFDRMLAAMELARDRLYLAPLSPARPPAGRLDEAQAGRLAALMRHHLALVRPRRLLLLGDAAIQAVLGQPCHAARGTVHDLDGQSIRAVASFHPRLLVRTPERKAAAWADLKLFMAL